ncbi:HopJ type III effector protein [Pseudomonas sp. SP16.1]|uniref:HopJ type III effector protein n=1 Tax=Pseudomonas sp. SP16.1 TaxID=3458854 RepID=UPI0040453B8B
MSALADFRRRLQQDDFTFTETLAFVAAHYHYQPSAFRNGTVDNAAGQNEGSCKTLGLALLEGFSLDETLRCFGEHYRSVRATPDGSDHGNIRALMVHGLDGVQFEQAPLRRQD